jgi:lysophospholipase L1-like esterase
MEAQRPRRHRRLLLVVPLQLAAALLALEVGLRLAQGASPALRQRLYLPGVELPYLEAETLPELLGLTPVGYVPRQRRMDFVLNSRGLKTREYADTKAPGALRVVVLGDSFAYASGGLSHDEVWPQRLEQALGRRRDGPVEVLSFGWPSVGPDFYRRIWELEGARLEADVVVVSLFLGNDLQDPRANRAAETVLDAWARHSYAVRLVRNTWLAETGLEEPQEPPPAESAAPPLSVGGVQDPGVELAVVPRLTEERFVAAQERCLRILDRDFPQRVERAVRRVGRQLEAIVESAAAADTHVVVMLVPAEAQVSPALARTVAESLGKDLDRFDLGAAAAGLAAWCAARDVACLDLTPAFAERARTERLYHRRDTHWNRAGNALAARELTAFLRARGWTE